LNSNRSKSIIRPILSELFPQIESILGRIFWDNS